MSVTLRAFILLDKGACRCITLSHYSRICFELRSRITRTSGQVRKYSCEIFGLWWPKHSIVSHVTGL